MTCNRNRRLLLRINLKFFTLRHCEIKRDFGGWVSFFIIGCHCYMFQGRPFASLCDKSR